jgi:predicted SAM-dependent methyltransferase
MRTAQKLNVGCGRNVREGWINLDSYPLPDVDVVADLENCATTPLPLESDSVNEFLLSHVLEHIRNVLPMMQELHRVAMPGATMVVRTPYGSSDDAFEDPTHLRQIFVGSFGYFSQPYYWRADYGYRGDWIAESITLEIALHLRHLPDAEIWDRIHRERNIVVEMIATLRAVKPIREPLRELQHAPAVSLIR